MQFYLAIPISHSEPDKVDIAESHEGVGILTWVEFSLFADTIEDAFVR